MNDICFLMSAEYYKDRRGNQKKEYRQREVFCKIKPAGSIEFHRAAQNGLKAKYKLEMWKDEYEGEKHVKYNSEVLTVYNTQTVGDLIILYLEERSGADGKDIS